MEVRRNLAFYKRSREPWTTEDMIKICKYCGDFTADLERSRYMENNQSRANSKWIADVGGSPRAFMDVFTDADMESGGNIAKCTQLAYEDLFYTISLKNIAL